MSSRSNSYELHGQTYQFSTDEYEVLVRLAKYDICDFTTMVEGYENIAIVTTLDPEEAVLRIQGTWDFRAEIDGILAALGEEFALQRLADNMG